MKPNLHIRGDGQFGVTVKGRDIGTIYPSGDDLFFWPCVKDSTAVCLKRDNVRDQLGDLIRQGKIKTS